MSGTVAVRIGSVIQDLRPEDIPAGVEFELLDDDHQPVTPDMVRFIEERLHQKTASPPVALEGDDGTIYVTKGDGTTFAQRPPSRWVRFLRYVRRWR